MKATKGRKTLLALGVVCTMAFGLMSGIFTACGSGLTVSCTSHKDGCGEETHKLYVSDTLTLKATGKEGDTFTWSEDSEKKVITVSKKGVVSAKGKGKATVTVKSSSGKTAEVAVQVMGERKVSIQTPEKTEFDLADGGDQTLQLSASSTDGKAISWSSSDSEVATVSADGLVQLLDVGTATITAMAGSAKASVDITVKDSNRGEDYRKLVNVNNSNCYSEENLGLWQYHADSQETNFSYTTKPYYTENSLGVVFSKAVMYKDSTNNNNKLFKFCLCPIGIEGIEDGDGYKITFKAKMNMAGKVVYATDKAWGGTKQVAANEEVSITYTGTAAMENNQVFYVSPRGLNDDASFENNGEGLEFKVYEMQWTRIKKTPTEEVDEAIRLKGDVPDGQNAQVLANRGEWRYFRENNGAQFIAVPHKLLNDSDEFVGIAAKFASFGTGKTYFRYMPTAEECDENGKFTARLTIQTSTSGTLCIRQDGAEAIDKTLTANQPIDIVFVGNTLKSDGNLQNPFFFYFMDMQMPADESGVSIQATNISFSPYVSGDVNTPGDGGTDVPVETNVLGARTNNAGTIADPGVMKYWADKESSVASIVETEEQTGYTASLTNYSKHFSYRYQPTAAMMDENSTFTITFTVVSSVDAYVRYGNKDNGTANYQTGFVQANVATTFTFVGTAASPNEPFSVRLQGSSDGLPADLENPPTVDLSGQSFTFTLCNLTVVAGDATVQEEPIVE